MRTKVDKKSLEVKDGDANKSSMNLDHDYTKKSHPIVVLRDISPDSNAEYTQKKHDIQQKGSAVNVNYVGNADYAQHISVSEDVDYTQKEDDTQEFHVVPNMFDLNAPKGDSTESSVAKIAYEVSDHDLEESETERILCTVRENMANIKRQKKKKN